jgi:Fe-S cluster assembly iron-binding protein IscA
MSAVAESVQPAMAAPFVFTDSVAAKGTDLIAEEGNTKLKLRVFVYGGGCSGFKHVFSLTKPLACLPGLSKSTARCRSIESHLHRLSKNERT